MSVEVNVREAPCPDTNTKYDEENDIRLTMTSIPAKTHNLSLVCMTAVGRATLYSGFVGLRRNTSVSTKWACHNRVQPIIPLYNPEFDRVLN